MATPPVFDGEYLDEEVVASIATHPYLHWEACRNRLGNAIDDCVIITELETMETIVSRVVTADPCRASGDCHGGYTVLMEHSTTYDSVEAYGSTGLTMELSGRTRAPREGRFTTVMSETMSFNTTITVARGYMYFSYELFAADGTSLDSYTLQMNAGTAADSGATIDCEAYAQTVADDLELLSHAQKGEMALWVIGGSTVAGGAIGFGSGALVGGVGAIPGAGAGALGGLGAGMGIYFVIWEQLYDAYAHVRAVNARKAADNFCEEFNNGYPNDNLPVSEIDPGNDQDANDFMESTPCPEGMVYAPAEACFDLEDETDMDGPEVVVTDREICYDLGWVCVPM